MSDEEGQEYYDLLPDHFEVIRSIRKGGMGRILVARDRSRDDTPMVAVKVLSRGSSQSNSAKRRFLREAAVLDALHHEHIIGFRESSLDAVPPYLVMEYVDGEDLAEVLRVEGPLSVNRVRTLALQLGPALDLVHSHGILHRDLKPANVLIRRQDDRFFLVDFGLASLTGTTTLTGPGSLLGTLSYLPPEVARGGEWSPAGDLFQLGALAFEALTGDRLIAASSPVEVLGRLMDGEWSGFPDDSNLPPAVLAAVDRALSLDAEERFESGAAFAAALAA